MSRAPLLRCVLVWLLVTIGVATALPALAPDLSLLSLPYAAFDAVLVEVAALALTGCLTWFWLVTTAVAVDAARGRQSVLSRPCPALLRRVLLAACGAALASGAALPALAADDLSLDGLPLPERATGSAHVAAAAGQVRARPAASTAHTGPVGGVVIVRPGDTLWDLAAATLPDAATDADITTRWHAVYAANRGVVGRDPDLILPGTPLDLARGEES